jgi:phytoene dehydrogenase-like protein
MPAPSVPPTYDAVVVGSGPNGLSAAITLAEAGRSVLVLEAAATAGGGLRTEELTLPGFRHDTFSAVHPAAAASPVFARLPLARHGLRWVHPRWCMAQVLPDGTAAVLARDPRETAASLNRLHDGDGDRWLAFVAPYLRRPGALRRLFLSGFPPLRGPAELLLRSGPRPLLELARVLLLPAETLAGELFGGHGARAWLHGSAKHGDVPLDAPGSAIVAVQLHLLGHASGWPSPEGGAGRLAEALVAVLREAGGEVRCGARVERVIVERGRTAGVLVGGEQVPARLVIGDVTPRGLLGLCRELPERYAEALRRYRYGPPTLKVDWALERPIPWSAAEAREAGTVHVGGDPFVLCGQQSIADPTRAPAGRHTGWAYTHAALDADAIEAEIEHHAPGFRDRILARHVLAPTDLEARDENLVGGDVGAGSYALDQLLLRPLPSLAPYRTPVRGLFIGSAAAYPGAGVHGVPGHAAARLGLALHPRGGR